MNTRALAFLAALTVFTGPAQAGPFSDALGKCLVETTTAADKQALVRWMFATAALHPAVKSLAPVAPAARENANREVARLFERLLSDSCNTQTRQAMQYEGELALQTGFQILGQVAGRELFADPAVAAGMGELEKHLDTKKLQRALAPQPKEP
jgi:hypothetical protein